MKKRVLGLLVVLSMLMACVPIVASAATSGTCGTNMKWNFDGVTLTISGSGAMNSYTADNVPWKDSKEEIREVIIEEGITEVSDNAFNGCWVVSATLPSTLKSISKYMFYNTRLRNIVIPDGVETIDENAFDSYNFCAIEIPVSVKTIKDTAFKKYDKGIYMYYTGSEEQWNLVDFPYNTSVYNHVIYNSHFQPRINEVTGEQDCWAFDDDGTLTVKEGFVGNIDHPILYPWYHCVTRVKKVVVEDGVTDLGYYAFEDCINLKSVELPNTITGIKVSNFNNCCRLESIVLPETITFIGATAFKNCTNLKAIEIPVTVKSFHTDATFENCKNLSDIYFTGSKSEWDTITNVEYLPAGVTVHYNSHMPKPIPITTPTVTKTETADEWQFEVSVEQTYEDSFVYAIAYDENGGMVKINHVPLNMDGSTSVSLDKAENVDTVKILVWTDWLQPITTVTTADIAQ